MITGIVHQREATIRLILRPMAGEDREIETVIDTGFTGSLTLPVDLINELGLSWQCREQGILGDGSVGIFDVYATSVEWDGQVRTVETIAAEAQPLVGMDMMRGYELRIQVIEDGHVELEAIT